MLGRHSTHPLVPWTVFILLISFLAMTPIFHFFPPTFPCMVTGNLSRHCYEAQVKDMAQIRLEVHTLVMSEGNLGPKPAFCLCGSVLSCESSPCRTDLSLGSWHRCRVYNADGLYRIQELNGGVLVFGEFLIYLIFYVIFVLTGFMFLSCWRPRLFN
jgi:hypothetical protein